MDATAPPTFLGGWGPLEIAMPVTLIALVVVVWATAKRAVTSRLPGYEVKAERVGDGRVEATVSGIGTASKIQFVVNGEVHEEVKAEPDANAVFEVAEDEELSVRKIGGN